MERCRKAIFVLYVVLFLIMGLIYHILSYVINLDAFKQKCASLDMINYCLTIIAVTIAEVIYWRTVILKGLNKYHQNDDDKEGGDCVIKHLSYTHMMIWVSGQGKTVLVVSVLIILTSILNIESINTYITISFIALLIYWAISVAILFFFPWQETIEKSFAESLRCHKDYSSFSSSLNKLKNAIRADSGALSKLEMESVLKQKYGFSNKEVKAFNGLLSFDHKIEKHGKIQGLKDKEEVLNHFLDTLEAILGQSIR